MKKTTTILGLMAITSFGFAQSPRMSLFEEFTGENCPPCASTNPVIDPFLATHQGVDCITLKWQVAIPSAPSSPTSLYQQNITEINARDNYYSISSAPSARLDGQDPSVAFGATSDHAYYITQSGVLSSATSVSSPFTIVMNRSYDPTYSTITVTGTITASQAYTAVGALKFRLVMTEKEIHYATAPGSNGEKDFHWVARKSFPDLTNGTAMASSWTAAQTQTFSISCPVPSYIWDKSQIEMVGFIQDDGNKKVLQAALSTAAPVGIDAQAFAIAGLGAVNCGSTANPAVVVKNIGVNAISTMTINPYLNTTAQTPYIWTGNLAAGATTTITLNPVTGLAAGTMNYSVNIVGVDAGDNNNGNNTKKQSFAVVTSYTPAPIVQTYTSALFPGTGWILVNTDGGSATTTWQRSTAAGGFGSTPAGCAKYNFFNNANVGDVDELFMPAMSLSGLSTAMLTFDVAKADYLDATLSSPYNDILEVHVSTDCGANWTTVYSKDNTNLATAPTSSVAFTPTAAQWRAESINLNSYAGQSQVLVKFVAINDYGNNLYIDNVNLSGSVGIQKLDNNVSSIDMFPNPATTETAVNIDLVQSSETVITVLNTAGQIVYQSKSTLNAGKNTVTIDTRNFASGIYNVIIATDNGSVAKKLSVTK